MTTVQIFGCITFWKWVIITEYIWLQKPNWNSPGFGVDLFQKTSTYLIDKDNCERFLRAHTQCTFCQQDLSRFLSFSWNLGMQNSLQCPQIAILPRLWLGSWPCWTVALLVSNGRLWRALANGHTKGRQGRHKRIRVSHPVQTSNAIILAEVLSRLAYHYRVSCPRLDQTDLQ